MRMVVRCGFALSACMGSSWSLSHRWSTLTHPSPPLIQVKKKKFPFAFDMRRCVAVALRANSGDRREQKGRGRRDAVGYCSLPINGPKGEPVSVCCLYRLYLYTAK